MMHWAHPYLGKPWRAGAAGPDAYDCWGLLCAVLAARAGIKVDVIAHPPEELRALIAFFRDHAEFANWREVDTPTELDAVVMAQAKHPFHVGVWVDANGGRVLHACRPAVVAQDRVSLRQHGYRIVGCYRHKVIA